MRKQVVMLDSDLFEGDVSREKLVAYFIGSALSGLCKSRDLADSRKEEIVSGAVSIGEYCYKEYARYIMDFDMLVRSVKEAIVRLEEKTDRGEAEEELLDGLHSAIDDYERKSGR